LVSGWRKRGAPRNDCYDGRMEATRKTPAKVNLCLLVGPTNAEGFHELFTVFAAVDLFDTLDIKLQARPVDGCAGDLKVKCRAADGEDNLAFKALKILEAETGWAFDGRIEIDKRIPVGGGLGGGSSDGACALLAGMEALGEAGGPALGRDQQVALARKVGADVAFFLEARPAVGRGIGEILEPIDLPDLALVLVVSNRHLSTERVYRAFDETEPFGSRQVFDYRAIEAEKRWRQVGDAGQVARLMENDLEKSAYRLMPTLMTDRELVTREGALAALVSGSGPTLYGVCASPDKAQELAEKMVVRGFKALPVSVMRGAV
jgi:4-diphosphocytidyl-2-C-methyl-D-erythritol kinase